MVPIKISSSPLIQASWSYRSFLVEHFPQVLDYHFTAKVEEEFDDIASGKKGVGKCDRMPSTTSSTTMWRR